MVARRENCRATSMKGEGMIDEKQTVKREDLLLQLKALAEEFQPQKGKPPKRMNDRDMEHAGRIAAQLLAPEGDVNEVWALLKVFSGTTAITSA